MHKIKVIKKMSCILYLSILAGVMLGVPSPALGMGSLSYKELREKFPNNDILFETLEASFILDKKGIIADVRVMSSLSEKLGGLRLGPYYVCGKPKFSSERNVSITIQTAIYFISKDGRQTEIIEPDTVDFRETITGVMIQYPDSADYFPGNCATLAITPYRASDNDTPEDTK